ncbi:XkdX family protein [Listeria aquatica]|uniref:XkdX family protein n=1 Tax=Listeria aquatica TaxID=1494960 RepID=UPI003EF6BF66
MIDWFEKVKEYYLGGFYGVEEVNKFVKLKKITQEQADKIFKAKEEQNDEEAE